MGHKADLRDRYIAAAKEKDPFLQKVKKPIAALLSYIAPIVHMAAMNSRAMIRRAKADFAKRSFVSDSELR